MDASVKILVYGAGPLGSLFAARLQQGGNDVSILARGQRREDLRKHGIVLGDVQKKVRTTTRTFVHVPSCQESERCDRIEVGKRVVNGGTAG